MPSDARSWNRPMRVAKIHRTDSGLGGLTIRQNNIDDEKYVISVDKHQHTNLRTV